MVKIRLIAVGKIRERYIAEAVADFRKRLENYFSYDEVEVAASPGSDPGRAVRDEGKRMLEALDPNDVGAKVTEEHRRVRPRADACEFDDSQSMQWSSHRLTALQPSCPVDRRHSLLV